MSKDEKDKGEIERTTPAPNERPMVVRREAEASRASMERVANAAERSQTMGDLVQEMYAATWVLCNDLMQSLEPISEPKLPNRDKPMDSRDSGYSGQRAGRDDHLKITSQEVAGLLSGRYPQLGFKRVRCYVKCSRVGLKVATYDIMVPSWNGAMLINPADSWAGSDKQWLGFRPATGPSDITVIPAARLPLHGTDKNEVPDRAEYKAYSADGFHWAKVDEEWQTQHKPDLAVCKLFIQETKDLLTEVIGSLEGGIEGLRDVLKVARGDHLLQLEGDAGKADRGAPEAPRSAAPDAAKPQRRGPDAPGDVDTVL